MFDVCLCYIDDNCGIEICWAVATSGKWKWKIKWHMTTDTERRIKHKWTINVKSNKQIIYNCIIIGSIICSLSFWCIFHLGYMLMTLSGFDFTRATEQLRFILSDWLDVKYIRKWAKLKITMPISAKPKYAAREKYADRCFSEIFISKF